MKRILAATLLLGIALGAGAQNLGDALTYSENDYLGTARSVAMGGAMTAVGGDLGSLTFNPAGSAVAGYSQFTITPGLSVSSVFGQGTYLDGQPFGFEDGIRTRRGRGQLPNFGAMIVFNTRNTSGLKRISFGIVGNMTRDFNNRLRASGTNDQTTLAGSLASQADGYPESVLSGSFYQDDIPSWETMVGYQAGLFDPIPGRTNAYVGLTERVLDNGNVVLADRIGQYYGLTRTGNKHDLLMNFGLDFSDKFYVGANVGITTMEFRNDETRSEDALSGGSYPSGFNSLKVRSAYTDSGAGIYAKVGFIARPTGGLRIGAAIQTPTIMDIHEEYGIEASSVASGVEYSQHSPSDDWYYRFRTPFRVNAGIAYTFGQAGLLSADYEYSDYRTMRFLSARGSSTDFSVQNTDIRELAQAAHTFRVGVEFKPIPQLALRTGYNFTSSPEVDAKAFRQNVAFGVGYSSAGSFFVDCAVRFQWPPKEFIIPYYYYDWDDQGTYVDDSITTPQICAQSTLFNALVTVGWRF